MRFSNSSRRSIQGIKNTQHARITFYQNGTLIHDDFEIPKKTGA